MEKKRATFLSVWFPQTEHMISNVRSTQNDTMNILWLKIRWRGNKINIK